MTNVKICGITNYEDAFAATEAGADLLGFIFYEPSPRYVKPDTVKEIVAGIRSQVSTASRYASPLFVGVFVNASRETVAHILDYCQLDAVQLHGDEPVEFVNYFKPRAFKALRPESAEQANILVQKYAQSPGTVTSGREDISNYKLPSLLIDAYHPTLYGGTGHVTDWTMAADIARQQPIMLAGSLTLDNVAEAIRAVQPWGVDVSSGVEIEKGKKDQTKVKEFVKVAKGGFSPHNSVETLEQPSIESSRK